MEKNTAQEQKQNLTSNSAEGRSLPAKNKLTKKNYALMAILSFVILLIYAVTIVKLSV